MAITLLEDVLKNKIIYSGYITCYCFLFFGAVRLCTPYQLRAQSYIKAVGWERVNPFFLQLMEKMCVVSDEIPPPSFSKEGGELPYPLQISSAGWA